MGEFSVSFAKYGWFPSILPSEEEQEDEQESGEEERD